MTSMMRAAASALVLALIAACSSEVDPTGAGGIAPGTWGGENAGLIADDSVAHVHLGCTYGNFALPARFDREGRLEAAGEYLLRAYPVAIGPSLPARLTGTLRGNRLTFTVIVSDTVARTTVVLGPATVERGREPALGPCPICAAMPAMP